MTVASLHHSFDLSLASTYSIEEAILIHHFQHWIRVNRGLNRNFHDGRYWTYQSLDEIAQHFPYWSKNQVVNIIEKLCRGYQRESKNKKAKHEPILMKGNYNATRYDRTVWYAFIDEEKFLPPTDKIDVAKSQNGNSETATPIPDTKNTCLTFSKEKEEKEIPFPRDEEVQTTEAEHQQLVKAHGLAKTRKLYKRLAEWKKDTPRCKWKKNDYRSIFRWVVSAQDEADKKGTGSWNKSTNRYMPKIVTANPDEPQVSLLAEDSSPQT